MVSDLKHFGYQDDGAPFIGEVYYVVATNERGDRFRHYMDFPGVRVEQDDHTGESMFIDTRTEAQAKGLRLLERIAKADAVSDVLWDRTRPVYGSEAYELYGADEDLAWERDMG